MDLGLKGKVALVTGAGSPIGFGKQICLTLAKEGCDVIVNDLVIEDAQKTSDAVKAVGRKSIAIKANVTKKADVDSMFTKALAEFGKIDILVNNAGAMQKEQPFLEQTEQSWDKDLNLNIKGAMFCCQAALPGMIKNKYGKIINITSSVAKQSFPQVSTYFMAKGAMFIFTRNLAKTYISQGITVNSIAPGWGLTNFDKTPPEELLKQRIPETPIGRGVTPQDIANAVAFLASEVSADIVGQIICVDGGCTMQ
jgi:NAD(P)-dependent dehydrogenase (short-subunit alcohol dehydrogenase family)